MSFHTRLPDFHTHGRAVKGKIAAFFLKEKGKGRLAKQADAEKMADFCIATIQGAMLMGKIKRSSRKVETTSQEGLAHLKGYVVHGERLRKKPNA